MNAPRKERSQGCVHPRQNSGFARTNKFYTLSSVAGHDTDSKLLIQTDRCESVTALPRIWRRGGLATENKCKTIFFLRPATSRASDWASRAGTPGDSPAKLWLALEERKLKAARGSEPLKKGGRGCRRRESWPNVNRDRCVCTVVCHPRASSDRKGSKQQTISPCVRTIFVVFLKNNALRRDLRCA
ncbi:hypothetical protein AVEN_219870-1 [Araneus ventricosus]|uniref:Uncharacterized protein n=1 Tax=Araneus ventricosus TaxID=182803 RepID=A0A4Y2MUQ7_ARAVE|nr:hypothetical protein AVEN_219870-1 [Araneus ventricosus]